MYDVISIGSSVVDSFIKAQAFKLQKTDEGVLLCQTYGEKIDVDEYIVKTGGGGSNTAVGFARMGFKTAVVTEIGKDTFADFILKELEKEVVSKHLIISEKNEQTGGSIILLGEDGGRTIMVHRGASAQLDPKDIPAQQLDRAKWIHVSSLSGQKETLAFIFDVVRDSQVKMSWNPGNKELELLANGELDISRLPVNILLLNKQEWEKVSDKQSELLKNISEIVVTNGEKGGEIFIDGKPHTKFMAEKTESVDNTGAGDSFAVGYVTAHIKGKSIVESCNWGKRNAQSVIKHVGAKPGLLTITQIERHNKTHE